MAAATKKDGKIFCAQRQKGKSLEDTGNFLVVSWKKENYLKKFLIREIYEELNSQIEIISVNEALYD